MTDRSAVPAIEQLPSQLKQRLPHKKQSLTIAIDGNEANVSQRVGSNVYAFEVLNQWHQMDLAHKFVIYLKHKPVDDMPKPKNNWQYKVVPALGWWNQIGLPTALFLSGSKIDVFYALGHYLSPLVMAPAMANIYDLAYLEYGKYFLPIDYWKLRILTQLSVFKSDRLVTISQFSKQQIHQRFGYPLTDIVLAAPGIRHDLFYFPQPDAAVTAVKHKYKTGDNYFLYVGTLQPRKNLVRLIEAFSKLKQPDYKLVIAGKKGWLYDKIYQQVKQHHLSRRVIFTGFVPETDLPALMAGARALTLVSLYEGFGIPVVEALAVGTPGIVSRASSLPEALGGAGELVNPLRPDSITQAMQKMIDLTREEYSQLVDQGVRHAASFTWQRTSQKILSALEEIGF